MMSPSWKIILGATFFALIPVGVKIAPDSGVLTLLTGRLLVAVLILFLIHKDKKGLFKALKQHFIKLFIWSLFMLGAMWCYFKSINSCGAGMASSLLGTQPVLMAVLSYFILKESIASFTWIAAAISLTGVLFVSNPGNELSQQLIPGIIAGITSSALLCFNFIYQKKWFHQLNSKDVVLYQSIMQLPILIPLALATEQFHSSAIPASLLLGIFCTVFAYSLIYSGARQVQGQLIGILQSIEYALPVPLGILFFHETFSEKQWLGVLLIIGSCILTGILSTQRAAH